jgi:hypothetical protein
LTCPNHNWPNCYRVFGQFASPIQNQID